MALRAPLKAAAEFSDAFNGLKYIPWIGAALKAAAGVYNLYRKLSDLPGAAREFLMGVRVAERTLRSMFAHEQGAPSEEAGNYIDQIANYITDGTELSEAALKDGRKLSNEECEELTRKLKIKNKLNAVWSFLMSSSNTKKLQQCRNNLDHALLMCVAEAAARDAELLNRVVRERCGQQNSILA